MISKLVEFNTKIYDRDLSLAQLIITAICISRLATFRSCSLFTYNRLSAYLALPLLPLTRNTIAKPPAIQEIAFFGKMVKKNLNLIPNICHTITYW